MHGIASEVQALTGALPEPEGRAYYSPCDAVLPCQLYEPMSRLPAEIPAFAQDLMRESGRVEASLPEQAPPVHHVLHDARHDLLIE